ncbi:MAG: hypothetical protein HKN25_05710 [Pyrinomonadaceae bacterium]|nr:hypothetical protein [Pyrinomonadaceae bacterium]
MEKQYEKTVEFRNVKFYVGDFHNHKSYPRFTGGVQFRTRVCFDGKARIALIETLEEFREHDSTRKEYRETLVASERRTWKTQSLFRY